MWDLLQSILLALLVALAIVGLWHLAALTCGYKVLPMYQRSACGSQVHQLAYITEHERHQLMAAGGSGKAQLGTQGVPCYPKRKRIDAFDEIDLEALNHAVDNDDTAPPHVSSLQVQVGRHQSQPDPVVRIAV